jgi:hypothetical protein
MAVITRGATDLCPACHFSPIHCISAHLTSTPRGYLLLTRTLSYIQIATFTLEQKANISTGVGWEDGLCVGNTPPVGDFPGLCLEDSPLGVRFADFATAFPAAINAAST